MKVEKVVKKSGKVRTVVLLDEIKIGKKGRKAIFLTDDGAEYISKMASLGCTVEEIADDMGVSLSVLTNSRNKAKYQEAVRNGRSVFKTSIRTSQMKIMKGGSAPMAIFLGKNYLDQADVKGAVEQEGVVQPIQEFAKALARYKDTEDPTPVPEPTSDEMEDDE